MKKLILMSPIKCGTTSMYDTFSYQKKINTCKIKEPLMEFNSPDEFDFDKYINYWNKNNGDIYLDCSPLSHRFLKNQYFLDCINDFFDEVNIIVMFRDYYGLVYSLWVYGCLIMYNIDINTYKEKPDRFMYQVDRMFKRISYYDIIKTSYKTLGKNSTFLFNIHKISEFKKLQNFLKVEPFLNRMEKSNSTISAWRSRSKNKKSNKQELDLIKSMDEIKKHVNKLDVIQKFYEEETIKLKNEFNIDLPSYFEKE